MVSSEELKQMISCLEEISTSHPYLVVVLMHDVTRNLYPNDPHLPFKDNLHSLIRSKEAVLRATEIARSFAKISSYEAELSKPYFEDIKDETGDLYGKVWQDDPAFMVENAVDLIKTRFSRNRISLEMIQNKRILDMGCGSGRYSCALSILGAGEVVGVDYGDLGLTTGEKLAQTMALDNVQFEKADFLDWTL